MDVSVGPTQNKWHVLLATPAQNCLTLLRGGFGRIYCEGKGVGKVDFEEANKVRLSPDLLFQHRPPMLLHAEEENSLFFQEAAKHALR